MPTLDVNSSCRLNSGRTMPVLGLGTWQLTDHTGDTVADALKLGYPMIDTSGDYGTQPGIAAGVKKARVSRNDYYLVTKVEEDEDPHDSLQKSLSELGTDHADLVLIHRPPDTKEDSVLLWRKLIRERDEGRTLDIGVSNYAPEDIDALIEATGETPAVNQIEWSPFGFSDEMQGYAEEHGIVLQAYSPLTRATRLDDPKLNDIARRHGKSPAQVLIRWDLQRGVVPIPKANRRDHLEQNFDVFDFELNRAEMADLEALNEHYSSLGRLPYV
jgi:diketogulonate reductase-like aldo/keto reductase